MKRDRTQREASKFTFSARIFCPLSRAQPRQIAKPCEHWKAQRRTSRPPLSPCGLFARSAGRWQRLEIDARSLEGIQVTANLGNRHPVANGFDFGIFSIRICDTNNLNFSSLYSGSDGVVCHALTGGKGGRLNLEKCLHEVSPVEVFNIAHDALINNTVHRITFESDPRAALVMECRP